MVLKVQRPPVVCQAVQVKMVLMVHEDHKVKTVIRVHKVNRANKVPEDQWALKVRTAKMV